MLCAFPPQSGASSTGADVQKQQSDDSGDSMVAESTMATRADQIIGPTPIQIAEEIGHAFELDDQQAVARLPQVTHYGMANLSSTLQDGGVEPEVAGFIQNAWKPSTRKQYAADWRQWTAWCCRKGLDAATPFVTNLINYLWYLFNDRRLSWHTLGLDRSAVATLIQPYAPETISEDKRVCRFMRATFLRRRPPRKLKPIWDVRTVLTWLENWGDIENLSRVRLTHRMVMLMAIASA